MEVSGHIIDIRKKRIFDGVISIKEGKISSIKEESQVDDQFIVPGFIDAHVHIESSMLVPSEFARLATVHGTVATVSDPHEIGNVLGVDGVDYMIKNGNQVNFKFFFGAPSCVPATLFETAGAEITSEDIDRLMARPEIKYLAEMMNWPGVLNKDPEVLKKINAAHRHGKPVDGHAPGLMGADAEAYIEQGISTDHECFTAEEARDKLIHHMKIAIREGSAAKNFEALVELFNDYPDMLMFCSDDKHPDNLVEGHINLLVKRALEKGYPFFDVLHAACILPIDHYQLSVGSLQLGDHADFAIYDDLEEWRPTATFINGEKVAEVGQALIPRQPISIVNNFNCKAISTHQIQMKASGKQIRVIEALDGQLLTNELQVEPLIVDGFIASDTKRDLLKLVMVNRYTSVNPAVGFIKNFNLKRGAIASSVGHDSHNIIAVGTNDEDIVQAINLVIEAKGGICALHQDVHQILPLPVAGLMSDQDGYEVAKAYTAIDAFAKELGCALSAPFMTLSFMGLLVIPALKLSDKGLFNGTVFEFTDVSF
jgi:adenine deaminase